MVYSKLCSDSTLRQWYSYCLTVCWRKICLTLLYAVGALVGVSGCVQTNILPNTSKQNSAPNLQTLIQTRFEQRAKKEILNASPEEITPESTSPDYHLRFPDIIQVEIVPYPEFNGEYEIDSEGSIQLPFLPAKIRLEGDTVALAKQRIINLAHSLQPTKSINFSQRNSDPFLPSEINLEQIRLRVSKYRSQFIYVYGLVRGNPRMVPYQGKEEIIHFIKRIGGFARGTDLADIYIVRSQILNQKNPQIISVDIGSLLDPDHQSPPIFIQPMDEVYIGESRRYAIYKLFPRWLQLLIDHRYDKKIKSIQNLIHSDPGIVETNSVNHQ